MAGDVAVTVSLSVSVAGLHGGIGDGEVELADGNLSVVGGGGPPPTVVVSVAGSGFSGGLARGNLPAIDLDVAVTLLHGGVASGSCEVGLSVTGSDIADVDVTLGLSVAGTGYHGGVGGGRAIVAVVAEGEGIQQPASGAVLLRLSSAATGSAAGVGAASATLSLSSLATGIHGGLGAAEVDLGIAALAAGWSTSSISGAATISLSVSGAMVTDVAASEDVLVMTARTRALSLYQSYPFNSIVQIGSTILGASAAGIFVLDGDDDNGVEIDASFKLGQIPLVDGAHRALQAWVNYQSNGPLDFTVSADGGEEYVYRMTERRTDGPHANRVKFGRGALGTRWQMGVANVNGADFAITKLAFDYDAISRRLL